MSESLIETLTAIAGRASELVLSVYGTSFQVDYKGPSDPVTTADRLANELICNELSRAFPGVSIVAEESAPSSFAEYRKSERVFFVDPVDGTREFVARNGEFVVMIGLLDGERPKAAVIQAPALGMTWVGVVGQGAFSLNSDGSRTPLTVSTQSRLEQSRVVSSRSHRGERQERAIEALGASAVTLLGSAGLKGAEVARGAAEVYLAPDYAGKRWDVCAAEALVVAAGGHFTDAHGALFDYRAPSLTNDRGVIGSNGLVHQEVVERLSAFRNREG